MCVFNKHNAFPIFKKKGGAGGRYVCRNVCTQLCAGTCARLDAKPSAHQLETARKARGSRRKVNAPASVFPALKITPAQNSSMTNTRSV